MDALTFLQNDHRTHEELLRKTREGREHYGALKQAIVHHMRVEELVFFPELLKLPAVEAIVREAWEEHNLCMQLLQELDATPHQSPQWAAKLSVLESLLTQHMQTEEENLFPRLRNLVAQTDLEQIHVLMKDWKYAEPTNEILYPEVPGSHHL